MSDAARACTSPSSQLAPLRARQYLARLTMPRAGTLRSEFSQVRSRDDDDEIRAYAVLFCFLRLLCDCRALSAGADTVFHPGRMERESVERFGYPRARFFYYMYTTRHVIRYLNLYATDKDLNCKT